MKWWNRKPDNQPRYSCGCVIGGKPRCWDATGRGRVPRVITVHGSPMPKAIAAPSGDVTAAEYWGDALPHWRTADGDVDWDAYAEEGLDRVLELEDALREVRDNAAGIGKWDAREVRDDIIGIVDRALAHQSDVSHDHLVIPNVWSYVESRWPGKTPIFQVGKVCEEAGEAIGAMIKTSEGRPVKDPVDAELADTIIAAIAALQALDKDVVSTVRDRWASVSKRTGKS